MEDTLSASRHLVAVAGGLKLAHALILRVPLFTAADAIVVCITAGPERLALCVVPITVIVRIRRVRKRSVRSIVLHVGRCWLPGAVFI